MDNPSFPLIFNISKRVGVSSASLYTSCIISSLADLVWCELTIILVEGRKYSVHNFEVVSVAIIRSVALGAGNRGSATGFHLVRACLGRYDRGILFHLVRLV